jgi:hypothetical protein
MKQLVLLIAIFGISQSKAQWSFKGVGIFGALTQSAHYYTNTEQDHKADTPYVFNRFYPPSHISKEFFNWGAGIFLELGRENLRWQTELEYANKGAKEKEVIEPYSGLRASGYGVNKNTYIQWNNYLKFYNPIGFSSHWYLMPGIRLEYLFKNSASVFTPVSGSFPKFWFSGDIGLGYEFPLFKQISGFAELHWNPDIIRHKHDVTKVRNRTFELRVGLVYRKKKRSVDDCNAPRYNGPAY